MSLSRCSVPAIAFLAPMALAGYGMAHAALLPDLIAHNGFETCWSQAITEPQFLDLLKTSIDAQTICVLPSSGSCGTGCTYSACNTAACPGAVDGCPVTIHADAFSGDFTTGQFTSSGTADDVAVPVTYNPGLGDTSCTIDVTGISLGFGASFFLQADGNNGDYVASVTQASVAVTSYAASSANAGCDLLASAFGGPVVAQVESEASTDYGLLLDSTVVGESVCPLTP